MRRELQRIGCAALLLLSACSRSYDAKSAASPVMNEPAGYPMAGGAPPAPPPPSSRSFESVLAVAPGVQADEEASSEREVGSETVALGFKAEEKPDDARVASGAANPGPASPVTPAPAPPPQPAKPVPGVVADPSAKAAAGEVAAMRAPLLVYTAELTVAVFEVDASLTKIEALAREVGGFLARRQDGAITIRVPAARFEDALRRIEAVGDVTHRNVAAEDVTEEFRDLEVRLKSLHAVQDRLTQLLTKAVKVEESVQIERELDRVTGEIDRIEGRMKFLRDRAAFSTITVTFAARPKEVVAQGPFRLPGRWLNELGLGRLLNL